MKRKLLSYYNNSKSLWLLLLFGALGIEYANAQAVSINMGSVPSSNARTGNFYDSGGPLANYNNNENMTFLISVPGATSITLNITAYNSENCCDYLRVFNGPNTSSPELTPAGTGLRGTPAVPITYTTTGSTMYITWYSDGSVTPSGWESNWSATFPPSLNDVGVASIDSPTIFCANNQNIYATVMNFGRNSITGFNVNWSLNGVLQTPVSSSATLDTVGGSNPSSIQLMLGNHTFASNVFTEVKAWTSFPNSVADTSRLNDTSTVYRSPALPGGTYTIGGTVGPNNFATIESAIAAMTNAGICGPVVFNIAPGTYNRTAPIVVPNILGASSINTITFDGLNRNNCIFTGNLGNNTIINLSATQYVTLRNISVVNLATSTPVGIAVSSGSRNINIVNCAVRLPVWNNTSSTGYCINISNTANGISATGSDSVVVDSCYTVGGGYGVVMYGNQNAVANRGLVLRNSIIDSCNYMGGYIAYNNNPITIHNNTFNMQGWNYGYYGLYFYYNRSADTAVSHMITNNRVNNFGYYGMYVYYPIITTTAAAPQIINNTLSSFTGGSYSGFYGIYLYNYNTACRADIYHNTISMNGIQTSTTSSALYSTGSNVLNVKNNIFAVYSGSSTPAYFATAPIGNTVNYNLYWNNTNIATGNLIYRGSFYTPANYLSATAGGDSSYNNAPSFTSRVNNNFALTDGCAGFGFPGLATTDINGVTRSLTFPSVGAHEYTGNLSNNLTVTRLLTPVSPITAGSQDLSFIVRNVGNNPVFSYNASYKLNNNTTVTQLMTTNTIAPCGVDTAVFTGTNQINLGAVNIIKAFTSDPNSLVDSDRSNDTLRAAFYTPLSGTYTVGGTNPNFATIAEAADVLANGVSGPVVFDIRPGTYVGQVKINGPITGSSDSNTVTFQGNDKATRIINANAPGAPAFFVDKASYVTIRNLTINNTGGGQSSGVGVVGTNSGNQGTKVNVINCNVNVPIQTSTSSSGYGIIYTGTAGATGISAMRADSVRVDSNTITGAGYGLVFYGATNNLYNFGNVFTNNVLNNVNYMGAYIGYVRNPIVFDNNTINVQGQNYGYYGLYYYNNINYNTAIPSRITRNKVNTFGYYGMYIYAPQLASTGAQTIIANNSVIGNSPNSSYPGAYGIYLYQNSSANIAHVYHNSVSMLGAGTSTTFTCFYNTGSSNTYVRNNIFVTNNGSYTPAYFATNITATSAVNHNIYYNALNPTSGNIIYRGTFYNVSNYKTANAGGDSSYVMIPPTSSFENMVLTNGCYRAPATGFVNDDITGYTRSANPNIGAYEYQGFALDLQVESMPYPIAPITLGAQNLAAVVRNNGTTAVTSFNIAFRLNNGTPVVQNWTGTLNACDTVTVVFSGTNQISLLNGLNNIKVYTYAPNSSTDGNPSNDTIAASLNPPMSGNYVIGAAPSNFTTFTDALNAMAGRGISGPVVFNVKTGTYNESITLNNVIGASASNTITFKSQANNVDSAILSWNSNSGNNFVVRFNNNANHYIFDRLTIEQTGNNVTSYGITLSATSSFDTIRNCKINMPIYPTTTSYTSYSIYASGYIGTGLCIDNNIIDGSYYGAYIYGASRTTPMKNVVVNGNTFNNFYYSSLYYFYYSTDSRISNNTFNVPTTSSTTMYSYYRYNDSAFKFTNNIYNGLSGRTQYMYLDYSQSSPANRSLIANNQVRGQGNMYFYVANTSSNNQDVVHNSFNLGSGYFYLYPNSLSNYRVMNNVFNASGTYAYYFSAAPNAATLTSDYNLVNVPGTTPYYATAARSLPAMRTIYAGLEGNSIHYRAAFTSPTNLIPNAADTAVWALNGRGNHLGYVLNDANNSARPQTPAAGVPDLGAFEVMPTAIAPLATAIPATPVAGGTQVFLFGNDTVAKITYDAFASVPSEVGVRQYTGVRHPQAGVNQNYTNVYADITANGFGGYQFDASLYYTNAQVGTNPSETNLKMARYNIIWNTYTGAASTVDTINNFITATYLTDFGAFIGTDDLNPLPVVLNKFVGKANNKNADLMWQTASEKNTRLFEIHSSIDGKNFKLVGTIKANGNSNITSTYTYTDVNALANNNKVYYKLKTVDVDGTFEWSNTVIVTAKEANNASIDVYPNPFNNDVTVSLIDNNPATIEVVTLEGVNVYNATTNSNSSFANINLTQLTAGVYFIKVTQNGATSVQKLVKQ